MLSYALDWLALLVRWLHFVAGVAWIGASFYFVWLDNHLRPPAESDAQSGIGGEVWAVHGGGFYRAQKYRLAPAELPPTLHWFYWEAYSTWLSGFALLCLLYFVRAEGYLIDPAVMVLSKPMAIGLALGALFATWLVYDALCRSALGRHGAALSVVLGVLFAAEAFGLCHLFSGRGAFMLFGSALGTVMVANVAHVIIPGQRELVRAKQQGREPDAAPGLRGRQRSVHNTYLTLPVLFVMISNHYPMTFGARYNWLVLMALSFAGAAVRAWFVARHKGAAGLQSWPTMVLGLGALALAAVVVALAPARVAGVPGVAGDATAAADERSRVQLIVGQRCVPCHAAHPTQAGFVAAPNGLMLDSLDQVLRHLPEIQQQLATRAMPLGNLTQMTAGERAWLLDWVGRAGDAAH